MKYLSIFIFSIIIFSSCKTDKKEDKTISEMSIKEINAEIERDSSNANLFQARAEIFYRLSQIDSALTDYKKAVNLEKDNIEWLIKLSDLYLFKGKSEKARQTLEEAISIEPNNRELLLKMGVLYLLIEDHLKSFEYINDALSVDPNFDKAYYYKSINYVEVGDTTRAIQELLKATEKNPEYTDAYIKLGLLHDALNDTIARVYYKNALSIDSTNTLAHYDLAMHYQHQEELNKAIRQYLYLIDHVDSTFSTAIYNIGYIYLLYSDELDTAISYFDRAIAIDYNYTEAYTSKGLALEHQKKYQEAFVEYQTALRITPDHIASQNGIKRISKFINKPN